MTIWCAFLCAYSSKFVCGFFSLCSQIWEVLCIPYTQKIDLIQRIDICGAFFINIFDMLVCFLVCFYVILFECFFLKAYQMLYVLHLHCGPFGVPFGVPFFINILDMLVCFLMCFYVKMASFNFFSNMGVPLCVLHLP